MDDQMPTESRDLVKQAIKALKINVPIYRAEVHSPDGPVSGKGNTVTLFLYGHRAPVKWTQPPKHRRGGVTPPKRSKPK